VSADYRQPEDNPWLAGRPPLLLPAETTQQSREDGGGGETGGGFQFSHYLNALTRYKWLIAGTGVLGASLSFGVFLLNPPLYYVRTTLEVFGRNENFMNFSQVDPHAGIGLYSANSSNLLTQIQVLMSESLRTKAIERLQLQPQPAPPTPTGLVARMRQALKLTPQDPNESARKALNLAVKSFRPAVVRETRVIEIQCHSSNPEVAARFLNTLVEEYIDQTSASRSIVSSETNEWLLNQLAEAKSRIDVAEANLADFGRKTGYTAPSTEETLSGARLRQLRVELSTVQAERIAKQAEWERLEKASPDALAVITGDSQLQLGQSSLLELRRQLAELLTTYTRQHPAVTKLTAQIEEVEASIAAGRKAVLDKARLAYETSFQRERMLTSAYTTQNNVFAGESKNSGDRLQLEREVDTALLGYNNLLQQVNQANMARATPSEYVRTIDRANPDVPAQGLGLKPVIALGLFSGLLFGAATVVTIEATNRTLRSRIHAARILQMPELAVIPTLPASRLPSAPGTWTPNRSILGLGSSASAEQAASIWNAQRTLHVESFRQAITTLVLSEKEPYRYQVIVVTSPGQGEGKSTVVANLGTALAEAERKVLLIDMDLRAPDLQEWFGVKGFLGVAEAVGTAVNLEPGQPLPFVYPTHVRGLSVMPASRIEPAQLPVVLFNPRLRMLLERLRQEYDFILIDTPPAGIFAEARVLGGMSDGVILVVREGRTSKKAAIDVRSQFAADGTPLIGTILNDSIYTSQSIYDAYYRRGDKSGDLARSV
jgi:capsular exopolysaccharide synthesis family protein